MTAIDDLVADIQGGKYSDYDQNLIAKVATMVAALQGIQSGTNQPFTNLVLLAAGSLSWQTRSVLSSPADGVNLLTNNAGNGFTRLDLGGITSAFPALARSAAALQARLADDSANANFICAQLQPSSTAGILGTVTNDNANAGSVGEFVETVVTQGAPVALVSGTPKDIATVSLTAGDWDVEGQILTVPNGATTINAHVGGISTTANTMPAAELTVLQYCTVLAGNNPGVTLARRRFSLSGTTTVRLVSQTFFAVNVCSACGYINARRVR